MNGLGVDDGDRMIEEEGFLSKDYDRKEIFIQADNNKKTVYSAYAYLLGLYPE